MDTSDDRCERCGETLEQVPLILIQTIYGDKIICRNCLTNREVIEYSSQNMIIELQ